MPREVVDSTSMETFRSRPNTALSNIALMFTAGELDQVTFKGPFQLNSMILNSVFFSFGLGVEILTG